MRYLALVIPSMRYAVSQGYNRMRQEWAGLVLGGPRRSLRHPSRRAPRRAFEIGVACAGLWVNRLLIVGILLIGTVPLSAQGQQPSAAKLKADARNLVGVIGGDRAKTQAYCQILDLIAQLNREKDSKTAKALSQKIDQLQKQLGPEFLAG